MKSSTKTPALISTVYIFSLLVAVSIGLSTFSHFFEIELPHGEIHQVVESKRVQFLFKTQPSKLMVQRLQKDLGLKEINTFTSFESEFFSRLFKTQATERQIEILKNHPLIEGVHVPQRVRLSVVYGSKAPSSLHNDTFAQLQWPLENVYVAGDETVKDYPEQANGHLVVAEQTDIQTEFVSSKPVDGSNKTYSVDYGETAKALADQSGEDQRTVTVAVIDSGVNFNHKDLKDNMAWNMDECLVNRFTGEIAPPKTRARDKDGNSFKGDCIGWNFSIDQSKNSRNSPVDLLGHGTHIAGIISAVRNNDYGIAGVSDRIKIMPIKVIGGTIDELEQGSEDEEGDDEDQDQANSDGEADEGDEEVKEEESGRLGFTDAVTEAILYATKNGADVINMSLGWPRIADLDIVRKAIEEARLAGVTIVAAAGNGGHSSLIMPCAIDGVICVGSVNNNGVVSSFSNHGGHVDLLAPGFGIFSTFPDDPRVSPTINGSGPFEIKDGTSQATPYVAAGAALLKLQYPDIQEEEILARMLSTARPVYKRNDLGETSLEIRAQSGMIQYEAMLNQDQRPVLYPSFKGVGLVEVDTATLRGTEALSLKSLWDTSKNVRVSVKSSNQDVRVTLGKTRFEEIAAGQSVELPVTFSFSNLDAESFVAIELTIQADGHETKTVWHQMALSRDLVDNDVVTVEMSPLPTESQLGLRHVKTLRGEEHRPTFYHAEIHEDQVKLHVLYYDGSQMVELPPVVVPDLERRFPIIDGPQESLFLLDLNDDGSQDYLLIASIQTEDGLNYSQLSYYDHEMKPLYGEQNSHIRLQEGFVIPNWRAPRFIKRNIRGLGSIRVPVFSARGILPEEDKPDIFEFPPEFSIADGTYYLDVVKENGSYRFKPRLIENPAFVDSLQKRLGIRNVDRLQLMHVLPQSSMAYQKGVVELLYHYDNIGSKKAALVTVGNSTLNSRRNFQLKLVENSVDFSGTGTVPIMAITDGSTTIGNGVSYFSVLEGTKLSVAVGSSRSNASIESRMRFRGNNRADRMALRELSPFMYVKDGNPTAVFQTGKSIVALTKLQNGREKVFKRRAVRSGFLPGFFFEELFYPTVVKSKGGYDPAVFVDATAVLSGNIMLWHVKDDSAKIPIRYNVIMPDNCLTADQAKWDQDGTMAGVLRCVDPATKKESLSFFIF